MPSLNCKKSLTLAVNDQIMFVFDAGKILISAVRKENNKVQPSKGIAFNAPNY